MFLINFLIDITGGIQNVRFPMIENIIKCTKIKK